MYSLLDQDHMDHLLAVSLKEDELSRALQDLDQSLIQARNAMQAAYAEVQRLVLLKQQVWSLQQECFFKFFLLLTFQLNAFSFSLHLK